MSYTSPLKKLIQSAILVSALGPDLGSVLVAIQLIVSDATLLAVTFSGADWGEETHVILLPSLGQRIDKLVHHLLSVFRSWCNAQPFLAAFHCGIVDGLHIHAVLGQHIIGNGCALCCITDLY